ncbi:glycosyltransferase family 2 protein [Catellicoccus marimammalium]|uniref:Bactoprenol glucosyl transferase n=1 Tax=Catellicoccus marimammalium M35/04/3 TaxID=1234409 RepID=K8ZAK3_9ENTE|nr:glycosyltransferase family 2 protein [Catellicoccus marimammalium]EKU27032.1 Bactoprenol glucosyl transferase [Catellicoccus marimammalium M35/04/3]
MKKLSIIIPCYNEEETVDLFYQGVEKVKSQLPISVEYEYLFVNDGSKDQTLARLRALQKEDPEQVHYLSFSRNFGKEAALYAGLQRSTGDYVVVMDADLQDPPEMLIEMMNLLEEDENLDCVGTRRMNREGEPVIRSFFANCFYKMINWISETKMLSGVRDYRMMRRPMVDAVLELTEVNRFSKGIFSWVGFETKYLSYQNVERVAGETSWSFWSLFRYSLEGIVNFSDVPLVLSTILGLITCLGALIGLIVIITKTLLFGDPTAGWPSLACIVLFIGGLQLFCLGIVGKYIGKIFSETKKRPIYIVKEEK